MNHCSLFVYSFLRLFEDVASRIVQLHSETTNKRINEQTLFPLFFPIPPLITFFVDEFLPDDRADRRSDDEADDEAFHMFLGLWSLLEKSHTRHSVPWKLEEQNI